LARHRGRGELNRQPLGGVIGDEVYMLSEDHLVRRIIQGVETIAKIFNLKMAGQYQEALQIIDQSKEQILGMNAEMVNLLDDESLYRVLTLNGVLDLERLGSIADLFKEEGDVLKLQDQKTGNHNCYTRSLNYYLKISNNNDSSHPVELSQKIDEMIQLLGDYDLPDATLFDLFCYYENNGDYGNANNILDILATRPEVQSDVRSEMISFYRRLLEIDPKELTAGGMSLKQIKSKLKNIE
jgi:hypothetical protein